MGITNIDFNAAQPFFIVAASAPRIKIKSALYDKEMSVSQLSELVGLANSPTSQHLRWLRDAGLVTAKRQHNYFFYRLADGLSERLILSLNKISFTRVSPALRKFFNRTTAIRLYGRPSLNLPRLSASYWANSTQAKDMHAVNDNAPAKTIEQAKSEFGDNLRTAIDGINTLTENLKNESRPQRETVLSSKKWPAYDVRAVGYRKLPNQAASVIVLELLEKLYAGE